MIRLFFCHVLHSASAENLANTRAHRAFIDYAKRGLDHNVAVGRYVLMPDHLHFFVAGDHEFDLGMWVRGLKRVVAAAATGGRDGKDPAAETAAATSFSPLGKLQPFWQRGFFDHLIRNTESYAQKWIMFAKILFVLAWSARRRNGNIKVKLWKLITPEDLPPVTAAATTCGIAA
jgi:REP element-mobilizing transposase RayT